MKPNIIPTTLLLAFACAPVASVAHAQFESGFSRTFALAPAEAASSGGGGAGDEQAQPAELATKFLNPVADLT